MLTPGAELSVRAVDKGDEGSWLGTESLCAREVTVRRRAMARAQGRHVGPGAERSRPSLLWLMPVTPSGGLCVVVGGQGAGEGEGV